MTQASAMETGRQNIASGADRISSLPDPLLHHILSFLHTDEAVATSLLSKRWRPLWLSLPSLDFDEIRFRKGNTFVQFVDAVLLLRDSQLIERFRLRCALSDQATKFNIYVASKFNIWINVVIKRKVQRLELFFSNCNGCLPSGVFICSTLRVLKLRGLTVNTFSSLNLPFLQVMHLEVLQFPDFECATMLLSGCTLLEDLVLKSIHATKDGSIGNVEGLRRLVRAEVPSDFIRMKAFDNVKFLRLELERWTSDLSLDIPVFHNLTRLEFMFFCSKWDSLVKWLQNCPKLQIIVMDQSFPPSSNPDNEKKLTEAELVPQCLSSPLKQFYFRSFHGSGAELKVARLIMMNATVLRTMTICSSRFVKTREKQRIIKRLSKCRKGSPTCELLFN